MEKSALVTGATGQDGTYLIELLLACGYIVHSQSRQRPHHPLYDGSVTWHIGSLDDTEFLKSLIKTARPDEVYNLAAISRPSLSWSTPLLTAKLNAFVPQQICELIRVYSPQTRFFQASSCDIFGDDSEPSQNENTCCDPKSPYAVAKYYAHQMVGIYRDQYGLHLSSGIMFNHESPRRPLSFVSQKIAHAAAALHLGITDTLETDERGLPILRNGKLKLGNLDIRRDFGFAGDYVNAMHAIVQANLPDDYVIGTGETRSIAEFCKTAFDVVGLAWQDHVVVDPELIRTSDAPMRRADARKLREKLGWRPTVEFDELVAMMVNSKIDSIARAQA